MKQIPKVFANKIDKKLENNSTYYKTSDPNQWIEEKKEDTKSVEQKIKEIFASPRYVYKAEVEITLSDKKITKKIIGKNGGNLITIDNELILISEIKDIKFKDQ